MRTPSVFVLNGFSDLWRRSALSPLRSINECCADRRIVSSSPFVSGSLTRTRGVFVLNGPSDFRRRIPKQASTIINHWLRSTQFGERGIGQGDNKRGAGSAFCRQRHREPQRQASARCTNSARSALGSTYRHAARKCPSYLISGKETTVAFFSALSRLELGGGGRLRRHSGSV